MPRSKTTRRNSKRRMHTKRVLKGGNADALAHTLENIAKLANESLQRYNKRKDDDAVRFAPKYPPPTEISAEREALYSRRQNS